MGAKTEELTSILGKDRRSALEQKVQAQWRKRGAKYSEVKVKATYVRAVKNGHRWQIKITW